MPGFFAFHKEKCRFFKLMGYLDIDFCIKN